VLCTFNVALPKHANRDSLYLITLQVVSIAGDRTFRKIVSATSAAEFLINNAGCNNIYIIAAMINKSWLQITFFIDMITHIKRVGLKNLTSVSGGCGDDQKKLYSLAELFMKY
jgi:hypothetical protein